MQTIIDKLPKGLTSALNLRTGGLTPRELAAQVVGTLDLLPLYLLDTRVRQGDGANAAAAVGVNFFTTNPIVVPPGELWHVWAYMVACVTGAGQAAEFQAGVNYDGLLLTAPLDDVKTVAASGQVRSFARQPFWAGPGSEFGFIVRQITGAPSFSGSAIITRLKV